MLKTEIKGYQLTWCVGTLLTANRMRLYFDEGYGDSLFDSMAIYVLSAMLEQNMSLSIAGALKQMNELDGEDMIEAVMEGLAYVTDECDEDDVEEINDMLLYIDDVDAVRSLRLKDLKKLARTEGWQSSEPKASTN